MATPEKLAFDDYETVAAAVEETERGRWFLAEHEKRILASCHKDVLAALAALDSKIASERASPSALAIVFLEQAIERARQVRETFAGRAPERMEEFERLVQAAHTALTVAAAGRTPPPEQNSVGELRRILQGPRMLSGSGTSMGARAPDA